MHWTYDDLMALPVDVYDELVAWILEGQQARAAELAAQD
jgi:hypothetical protein